MLFLLSLFMFYKIKLLSLNREVFKKKGKKMQKKKKKRKKSECSKLIKSRYQKSNAIVFHILHRYLEPLYFRVSHFPHFDFTLSCYLAEFKNSLFKVFKLY